MRDGGDGGASVVAIVSLAVSLAVDSGPLTTGPADEAATAVNGEENVAPED